MNRTDSGPTNVKAKPIIFCMSTCPPGGKALDALSLYPLRYNLKLTLRQGESCKKSVNVRRLIGRGDLECPNACIDDFRGGATSRTPSIGDSVLRENWTTSPGVANERAETIRHYSALPAGNHSTCASTRFYIDGNPTPVLRFPRYHSRLGTLANALPKKAGGVG